MKDVFDEDLKGVLGKRYIPEKPPVAKYERSEEAQTEAAGFWNRAKFLMLFMALLALLAWTADLGLVDGIVAVPGMCVCSACFGWNLKGGSN